MVSEGVYCLQDPVAGPYTEPDESSPFPPTLCTWTILILASNRKIAMFVLSAQNEITVWSPMVSVGAI